MTAVFIGGSRRISRLAEEVRQRIDSIVLNRLQVLIGDANGADKAVQKYLNSKGYDRVEVFCTDGKCRNNLGGWPTRTIPGGMYRRAFTFRTAKDREMAKLASVGFMIWDGRSVGTLLNTLRLVRDRKKVVIYVVLSCEFVTVEDEEQLNRLVSRFAPDVLSRLNRELVAEQRTDGTPRQASLF